MDSPPSRTSPASAQNWTRAMPDRATHCPGCGIPITDWEQVTGTYVVLWPCGCWITDEQAEPILAARGDDT